MIKFKKPVEGDFYTIFTKLTDGKKYIHINSYFWPNPDDDDWKETQYSWILVSLDSFVFNYSRQGTEYIEELYETAKQYERSKTTEEVLDLQNSFFKGQPVDKILDYKDITVDTPNGHYVKLFKKETDVEDEATTGEIDIPFSVYRVIRIDGHYDPEQKTLEEATASATELTLAEANSNMQYNGWQDGVIVDNVTDCGPSI